MFNTLKSMLPEGIKKLIFSLKRRSSATFVEATEANNSVLNGLIAHNKYGSYFTPLSSQHRSAIQILLRGEVYEPETIEYMRKNCGTGDIVHAGTFFGDFLPALSTGLDESATVWAFEPNPENFNCAKITVELNKLQNIKLTNAGLGAENSKAKMQIESEKGQSLGGSSKVINASDSDQAIDIDILSIDKAIPENRQISVIQLDVEGYEKDALEGAIMTIKRCQPILILEDNNNIIGSDWFKNNIGNLGYVVSGKVHNNTILEVKK